MLLAASLDLDRDPAELDLHWLQGLRDPVPEHWPYFVVAAGIVVSVLIIAWLIGRLNRLYVQITGTNRPPRCAPPGSQHA